MIYDLSFYFDTIKRSVVTSQVVKYKVEAVSPYHALIVWCKNPDIRINPARTLECKCNKEELSFAKSMNAMRVSIQADPLPEPIPDDHKLYLGSYWILDGAIPFHFVEDYRLMKILPPELFYLPDLWLNNTEQEPSDSH